MTDLNFFPATFHQPNKFSVPRGLRQKVTLVSVVLPLTVSLRNLAGGYSLQCLIPAEIGGISAAFGIIKHFSNLGRVNRGISERGFPS